MLTYEESYNRTLRLLSRQSSITARDLIEKLGVGYNCACMILEEMEDNNILIYNREKTDADPIYHVNLNNLSNATRKKVEEGSVDNTVMENKKEESNILMHITIIAAGALLFFFVLKMFFGSESSSDIDYCNNEEMAYLASQQMIKSKLKSPSTAKFPHYSEVSITSAGLCSFQINGYVDAQNSFGALVRDNYITVVTYDEKNQTHIQKSLSFN